MQIAIYLLFIGILIGSYGIWIGIKFVIEFILFPNQLLLVKTDLLNDKEYISEIIKEFTQIDSGMKMLITNKETDITTIPHNVIKKICR